MQTYSIAGHLILLPDVSVQSKLDLMMIILYLYFSQSSHLFVCFIFRLNSVGKVYISVDIQKKDNDAKLK